MRTLALPRLDTRIHTRLAKRMQAPRNDPVAVPLLAGRAPQQRIEVLQVRLTLRPFAPGAHSGHLGRPSSEPRHFAVQRQNGLFRALSRSRFVVGRGQVLRHTCLGRGARPLRLGKSPPQHRHIAVRLGQLARMRLHTAAVRTDFFFRLHKLRLQPFFRVHVPFNHFGLALGTARERPLLCL